MGITVPLDLQKLRTLLGTLLAESGYPEARIRVTLAADGLLVVQMSLYEGPPVDLQERGISCGLIRGAARSTPEAKQTSWIDERKRLSAAQDVSHYEWLLSNSDGEILEGTSSNFYLILRSTRDDRLVLKTADTGVLAGTARAIVLEVAPQTFSVALDAPVESELEIAVEACISSASRGVIPITSVEGVPIGSGAPGRAVQWLIRAYDLRAAQLASPLTM
jgi:branched-subunit amino acid aminotransferase/4-amino-4-deoxychorismate lyase